MLYKDYHTSWCLRNRKLNKENRKIIIEEEHYTLLDYALTIKPTFSALGSIIEISTQGPVITFVHDDSTRDVLGFRKTTIYEKYNQSRNPVDFLSFVNFFLECAIAQGMIFKGRRRGKIHKFTMDVDPGYKYIENFRGGIQLYMMQNKDVISSISFKLKNENKDLVSTNNQTITFRLSIKKILLDIHLHLYEYVILVCYICLYTRDIIIFFVFHTIIYVLKLKIYLQLSE